MWKCAIALLCCAFGIEPLFAQEVDWAYHGYDVYNDQYVDIDQITPANVSQLKPAWTFHTGLKDPAAALDLILVHDSAGVAVGQAVLVSQPGRAFSASQERRAGFKSAEPLSELQSGDGRDAGDQVLMQLRGVGQGQWAPPG